MNSNNHWLFLLLYIVFTSCQRGNEDFSKYFEEKHFNQFIASKEDSYSKFLIIPGSGCEGCISQAEQYVINNAKTQIGKTIIIFTNIGSKKLLKLRLGREIIEQPNILFDSLNILYFKSIYPILVERNQDGVLISKELKTKLFSTE